MHCTFHLCCLLGLLLVLHTSRANAISRIDPVSPQIVGGKIATQGDWKWQALLKWNTSFRCGGTLIQDEWVLTAAHCVYLRESVLLPVTELNVTLGEYDRTQIDSTARQVARVRSMFVHPGYKGICCANDIALLRLERGATLNSAVATIPLHTNQFDLIIGMKGTTTGWGQTASNQSTSNLLREVELTVTQNDLHHSYFLTSGEGAVCFGDSGGPFVVNHNGVWLLAGVTSFGGCNPGGGFTRVSSHVDWIVATLDANKPIDPNTLIYKNFLAVIRSAQP